MNPIRIFIGTEEKTRVADKVLAHTITRNTKAEVEITPMIGPQWEYPTKGIKQGTGFSLRRWMIPAACGYDGYAIYLDADQIVFGDIAELYELGKTRLLDSTAHIACTHQPDKMYPKGAPQTSVMVLDCWRLKHNEWVDIDKVVGWLKAHTEKKEYAHLMHGGFLDKTDPLPVEWNHLNEFLPGRTKLLHYTKEPEQPWYKPDHPLSDLWKFELVKALQAGVVTRADMDEALAMWGKKVDWRPTNGLHPHYKKFLVSAVK